MFLLIYGNLKVELIEVKSRMAVTEGQGTKLGRCWPKDIKFQLDKRNKFMRSIVHYGEYS